MSLRYTAVVAMATNRAIGINGTMPWNLPEDLKIFRQLTTQHPIVMGRKTFESIGRPLPNRQNIILSRKNDLRIQGCESITSLSELEHMSLIDEELMIIGGAQIYELALPLLTTLWVSEVRGDFEADTYFPEFLQYFSKREVVESFADFTLVKYTREMS